MRRVLVVAVLCALTAACTGTPARDAGEAKPAVSSGPGATSDTSDTARFYAAMLRRYLTSPGDNSNLAVDRVFVLDRAHPDAGNARTRQTDAGTPISAADQRRIVAALGDVAPVQFVANRTDAVVGPGCGEVRDHGILITLGTSTVVGGETRAGVSGWASCTGGTWLTYVLAKVGDEWQVTGTTGEMSVS